MKKDEIIALLNPNKELDVAFNIEAAIEHIQMKTNKSFEVNGVLDLPTDLVKAVKLLVDSSNESADVASESVGGELSVTYFNRDAVESAAKYWRPYRKLAW